MEYIELLQKRFATKKFNDKTISTEDIDKLLEMIRLSASSYGLQPYKIKIVPDEKTKEELLPFSFNQPQITTCSHILVFCANTDIYENIEKYSELMRKQNIPEENIKGFTNIVKGSFANKTKKDILIWAQKQVYLAVTNAINGAKVLGFDSCPMEGFIPEKYSEILNLDENLRPTVVVPIGYSDSKGRDKIRFSKEDLFF